MENYVLVYRFRNNEAHEDFTRFIIDKYPEHRVESNEFSTYIGLPARHEAEVEGVVNEIIEKIPLSEGDYASLYFTRNTGTGNVKQNMFYGHAKYLENDLQKIPKNYHDLTIFGLLDEDYAKMKMMKS